MATVFKIVALSVIGVLALFIGIGAVLPRDWHVSESITIAAAPEAIHPYVNDLRRWRDWAIRTDVDPTLEHTYPGKTVGTGAVQHWHGQHTGSGTVIITRSDPQAGVWFDEKIDSDEVNARGSVTYEFRSGLTTVTWTDEGTLPKVIGAFFVANMQQGLRAHFQRALSTLKELVEKSPSNQSPAPAP